MDALDRKILNALQTNAKITTKELATKLHLSVTAVYERIKKLEREGLIQNYVDYVNIWFASQTRNSFFNSFLFLILRKDRKAHFAIQGKVHICG